ncbi:MAG: PucR family transcriptional regulator ligand-binding domain-containing protein [Lachnospiraceae bacterium]|nr:PucR family transcriptional regulator ligand-binding domain-containing protein [Lachnospiraceae bacterium]
MAKVSDLLNLPIFREIQVIAGHNGLSRTVRHVTVMEVPDIKRWLKGNDFLITSFYSVRKSEEEQCRLIEDLADTCCCVAVKTGEYVAEIPESVRETAESCGLPLLEIPYHVTYIDLIINIMNLIFEEEGTSAILEKYVKDILYENYTDEILMVERGRLFGFEVEKDHFAAVNISFRKKYIATEQEKKKLRFLCQTIQQFAKSSPSVRECYKISLKKGWLLLLEGEHQESLRHFIHTYITEEFIKERWTGGWEVLSCGIGPVLPGMLGIRDTYSASFKAMRVGHMLKNDQFLFSYDKLRTFCVLQEFFAQEKGQVLKEVLESAQSQELIDTLVMYYECGASLDKTAERMFTHKNTVKYRLNRLQERTGLSLKNPDENFQLYLAVLAMKLGGQ